MRHFWTGALGAAFAYPLIWYYSAPDSAASAEPARTLEPALGRAEVRPAPAREAMEREAVSRTVTERLPAGGTASLEPVLGPQRPMVEEPHVPVPELAVMPELKETLERVAEVQQRAHSPAELDRQIQTLDGDPAKLAKLKALADLFLKLPTPRSDDYLRTSTGAPGSATAP